MTAPASHCFRLTVAALALAIAGCSTDGPTTTAEGSLALDRGGAQQSRLPAFDLNVHLRGAGEEAEGLIKFRQPDDGVMTIFLDTRVEGLLPNHDYLLQRAALTLGNGCVDRGWLTLGLGTVATAIHTDDEGEGRANLFRALPAAIAGTTFDIHFRVIDAVSSAVALTSECLKYTANPN